MSVSARHLPGTQRLPDWRDDADCRQHNWELWYPKGSEGPWLLSIATAKAICATCPVKAKCLQLALDTYDKHGIFGGLTPEERASRSRSTARRERLLTVTPAAPKLPPPATLKEAYQRRTQPADDGHVLWQGHSQIKFRGQTYNALRLAFKFGHGREPEGRVERRCDRACFEPEHLVDAVMRYAGALCGSRNGYTWHRRQGEPACDGCKRANADRDSRLRRTGTTLELAS